MRAFDQSGREQFRVVINTICPIAHAEEARVIAFAHVRDVEGNGQTSDTIEQMLQTKLGPIGSGTVTHVWCSRSGFTNQVEMQVETLANTGLRWCGTKAFKITNDLTAAKLLFCCIVGDPLIVLSLLGLEVQS